jgi:hypothetical protein
LNNSLRGTKSDTESALNESHNGFNVVDAVDAGVVGASVGQVQEHDVVVESG